MPGEEVVIEYDIRVPLDMARELGDRVREGRFALGGIKEAWDTIESVHRSPAEVVVDFDHERGVALPLVEAGGVPEGCLGAADIRVPSSVAAVWKGQGLPLLLYAEEVERRGRNEPYFVLISADWNLYLVTQFGLCVRCLPSIDSVSVAKDGWTQVSSPHNGAVLFRCVDPQAPPFTLFSPVHVLSLNLTAAHTTQNMPTPLPPLPCFVGAVPVSAPVPVPMPASPAELSHRHSTQLLVERSPLMSIPSPSALRQLEQSDTTDSDAGRGTAPRMTEPSTPGTLGAGSIQRNAVLFAAVLQWKAADERKARQGLVLVNRRMLEINGRLSGPIRMPLEHLRLSKTSSSVVASLPPQVAQIQGLPQSVSLQAHDAQEMDRLMLAIDSGIDVQHTPASVLSDTASDESSALPTPPVLMPNTPPSTRRLQVAQPNRQFVRTPGVGSRPVAAPVLPQHTVQVPPAAQRIMAGAPPPAPVQPGLLSMRRASLNSTLGMSPSAPVFGHQNLFTDDMGHSPVPIFSRNTVTPVQSDPGMDSWSAHDSSTVRPSRRSVNAGVAHMSELPQRSLDAVSDVPRRVSPLEESVAALVAGMEGVMDTEEAERDLLSRQEASQFHSLVVRSTSSLQHASLREAAAARQDRHHVPPSATTRRTTEATQQQHQHQAMQLLRAGLAIEGGEREGRGHIQSLHEDWMASMRDAAQLQRTGLALAVPSGGSDNPAGGGDSGGAGNNGNGRRGASPPPHTSGRELTARSLTTGPLRSFASLPGAGSALSGTHEDRAFRSGAASAKQIVADEALAHPELDPLQRAALHDGLVGHAAPGGDSAVGMRLAYTRGRRARSALCVVGAVSGAPQPFWGGVSEGTHRAMDEWARGTLHGLLLPHPVAESSLPTNVEPSLGLSAEAAVIVAKLGDMGGGVAEVVWANSVNPPWAVQERWVLVVGVDMLWLCNVDGSAAQSTQTSAIRRVVSTHDGWVVLHLDSEKDLLCRPLSEAALLVELLLRVAGEHIPATTCPEVESLLESNAVRVPQQPAVPLPVAPVKVTVGGGSKARTDAARAGVEAAIDLINAEPAEQRRPFAYGLMTGTASAEATEPERRGAHSRETLRPTEASPADAFWEGIASACEGTLAEHPPPEPDMLLTAPPGEYHLAQQPQHHHPQHAQQLQHSHEEHLFPEGVHGEEAMAPVVSDSPPAIPVEWRDTLNLEVSLLRKQLVHEAKRLSPPREMRSICGSFSVRSIDGEVAPEVTDERCELCLRLCPLEAVDVSLLEQSRQVTATLSDRDLIAVVEPMQCAQRGHPLLLAAQKVVHVGPSRSAHRLVLATSTALYVVQGGEGRPCRVRRCVELESITEVLVASDSSFGLVCEEGLPLVLRASSRENQQQLLALLPGFVTRRASSSAASIHSSLFKGAEAVGCDFMVPLDVACAGGTRLPLRLIRLPTEQLQQVSESFASVPHQVQDRLRVPQEGHVAVVWGASGLVAVSDNEDDAVPGVITVTPTAVTVMPFDDRLAPRSVPIPSVDVFISSTDGWLGVVSATQDGAGVAFKPDHSDPAAALKAIRRACGPARIRCVDVQHFSNVGVSHDDTVLVPVSVLVPGTRRPTSHSSRGSSPDTTQEAPPPPPPPPPPRRQLQPTADTEVRSVRPTREVRQGHEEHIDRTQGRASRHAAALLSGTLVPPPVRGASADEVRALMPGLARVVDLSALHDELRDFFAVLQQMNGQAQLYWVGKCVPHTAPQGSQGPSDAFALFVTHSAVFIAASTGRITRCTPLKQVESLCIDGKGGLGIRFTGSRIAVQCGSAADAASLCHVLTQLCPRNLHIGDWDPAVEGALHSDEALDEILLLNFATPSDVELPPPLPLEALERLQAAEEAWPQPHVEPISRTTATQEPTTPFSQTQHAATPPSSKPTWGEYKRRATFTSPQLRPLFEEQPRPRSTGVRARVGSPLGISDAEGEEGTPPRSPVRPPPRRRSDGDARPEAAALERTETAVVEQQQQVVQRRSLAYETSGSVQLRAEISILQHTLKEQRAECDQIATYAQHNPRLQVTLDVAQAVVQLNTEVLRILQAYAAGDQESLSSSRQVTLAPVDLTRLQDDQARNMGAHLVGEEGTVPLLHFASMVTTYELGAGMLSRTAAARQMLAVGDRALYLISTDTRVDRCIDLINITDIVYAAPEPSCYVGLRLPGQWNVLVRCPSYTDAVRLRVTLCNLCPGSSCSTLPSDSEFLERLNGQRPPDSHVNEADLIKITYVTTPFLGDPAEAAPQPQLHQGHGSAQGDVASVALELPEAAAHEAFAEASLPPFERVTHSALVESVHPQPLVLRPVTPLDAEAAPAASAVQTGGSPPRVQEASLQGSFAAAAEQRPQLIWDRENGLPCTEHAQLPSHLASLVPLEIDPIFYVGGVMRIAREASGQILEMPVTLVMGRHSLVLISEEEQLVTDKVAYSRIAKVMDEECKVAVFVRSASKKLTVAFRLRSEVEARELAAVLQTLYRHATGGKALEVRRFPKRRQAISTAHPIETSTTYVDPKPAAQPVQHVQPVQPDKVHPPSLPSPTVAAVESHESNSCTQESCSTDSELSDSPLHTRKPQIGGATIMQPTPPDDALESEETAEIAPPYPLTRPSPLQQPAPAIPVQQYAQVSYGHPGIHRQSQHVSPVYPGDTPMHTFAPQPQPPPQLHQLSQPAPVPVYVPVNVVPSYHPAPPPPPAAAPPAVAPQPVQHTQASQQVTALAAPSPRAPPPPPLRLVATDALPPELKQFESLLKRRNQTALVYCLVPCLRIAAGRPDEPRVLLVSNAAVYQMSSDTRVNRCVPLHGVTEVVYTAAGLLGLRVPTEFDMLMRVAASDVTDVVQSLRALHRDISVTQLEYSVTADSIEALLTTVRPEGWAPSKSSVLPLTYIGPREQQRTVTRETTTRTQPPASAASYAATPAPAAPSAAGPPQRWNAAMAQQRAVSPPRPRKEGAEPLPAAMVAPPQQPVQEPVPEAKPDPTSHSQVAPCGLTQSQIHEILF